MRTSGNVARGLEFAQRSEKGRGWSRDGRRVLFTYEQERLLEPFISRLVFDADPPGIDETPTKD